MKTRDRVKLLHADGMGTFAIAKELGLSKASISYHKAMLGIAEKQATDIDWTEVQKHIDANVSRKEILRIFRIGSPRYTTALNDGKISKRVILFDPDTAFVEKSKAERKTVKRYLLKNNLLSNTCAICSQSPEWNGRPLVLVLDHINGVNNDHRLDNLRLLCPNCNSQTETFAGRNVKRNP